MKDRLKEIIEYKTGGRQTEFCKLLGWTPPYLSKLLKGSDFGIRPVIRVLEALPEIDARWLLLGEGAMLNEKAYSDVRREMLGAVSAVLELEKYLPVMTPDELREFEQAVTTGKKPDFSPAVVSAWAERLCDREKVLETKFAAANNNSKAVCRQKKAKQ